jgi:hypothetical protein
MEHNPLNGLIIKMTTKSGDMTFTQKDTLGSDEVLFNNGTWSRSGDILTVDESDGITTKLKILDLTDNNLTLKADTLGLGIEDANVNVTMTLKK